MQVPARAAKPVDPGESPPLSDTSTGGSLLEPDENPLHRYLNLLESADRNKIDKRGLRGERHHSEKQGAVAMTWMVSFDAIRARAGGSNAFVHPLNRLEGDSNSTPHSVTPKVSKRS